MLHRVESLPLRLGQRVAIELDRQVIKLRQAVADLIGGTRCGSGGVVQLMSKTRRQLSKRGHLLALPQLFLDPSPLCDVHERDDGPEEFAVDDQQLRPVLRGEAGAVEPPDDLVPDVGPVSLAERRFCQISGLTGVG